MSDPLVLILCHDQEFLSSYVEAASQLLGGASIVGSASLRQLASSDEGIPASIDAALVDVSAIDQLAAADDSRAFQTAIQACPHVLVLVPPGSDAAVLPPLPNASTRDRYPPDSAVRELVQHLQAADAVPAQVVRIRPSLGMPGVERPVAPDLDEHLSELVDRLLGPIHLDWARLASDFVSTTSELTVPESDREDLPEAVEIGGAVDALLTYYRQAKGSGAGRVVVGEKGSGKTTLTHYAASRYLREDESFLFVWVDYRNAPFYGLARMLTELADEFFRCTSETRVRDPEALKALIGPYMAPGRADGALDDHVSLEMRVALTKRLRDDENLLVSMYCHYRRETNTLEESILSDGTVQGQLLSEAHEWAQSLKERPFLLLLHTLWFELDREEGDFDQYSWREIIRSLGNICALSPRIREQVSRFLPPQVQDRLQKMPDGWGTLLRRLRRAGVKPEEIGPLVLDELSVTNKVLIFLDNFDQKPHIDLEARLLRFGLSFLQDLSATMDVDFVVCVRTRTFLSPHFRRLGLIHDLGWRYTGVRPPDLVALLERRIATIVASGDFVGTRAWWFIDFLQRWVATMKSMPDYQRVVHLICQRHPVNVRGQLEVFARAATSPVLHDRAERQGGIAAVTSWADLTDEFCLRACVWGNQSFFTEVGQEFVPNIYTAGDENEPLDFVLIPMLLEWASGHRDFTLQMIRQNFVPVGVPNAQLDNAINKLQAFDIIRQSYDDEGAWGLTVWGTYFREQVAYTLAYIQTVWWDTPILEGFGFGEPRIIRVRALRAPAQAFERMLRTEEMIARQALGLAGGKLLPLGLISGRVAMEFAASFTKLTPFIERQP